jgi:serine phosphatase RsbU (regulator of sigma subunit)
MHMGRTDSFHFSASLKRSSAKEIVYAILEDVVKYTRDGMYSDDKTLVVIKRVK